MTWQKKKKRVLNRLLSLFYIANYSLSFLFFFPWVLQSLNVTIRPPFKNVFFFFLCVEIQKIYLHLKTLIDLGTMHDLTNSVVWGIVFLSLE